VSTATAGPRGKDVRSDCWVSVEPAQRGGIVLELTSKVGFLYGDSIRSLVQEELKALGVENARVQIEDQGALPPILAARVETAVRRAYPERQVPESLPEMAEAATRPSARARWRRSRLYLPGNQPKFMLNAHIHEPDGVILDLEDSVPPAEKDAALVLVRNMLRVHDFGPCERMVRINQFPRGLDEVRPIVEANVHLILIPKVESADQVRAVHDRVQQALRGAGDGREVFLMPIVESALGAIQAYEIATGAPSVVALSIGLEDYTADIGTSRTNEGRESFWARCQVVNAAKAAGVQAIDSVFSDVADMEALRASVLEAKGLGFEGKGCIHPRQIQVIHEALAPTKAEVDRACKIVLAFQEAERKGLAAVSLGSKMIDPPVVKRAQRTVEMAVALGVLARDWSQSRPGQDGGR
jgi:citrate lyase subunit beta/citryl-CoA lyase